MFPSSSFLAKAVRKAVLAERVAARNSERLATLAPDEATRARLVAEAEEERRHAEALEIIAARDGVAVSTCADGDHQLDAYQAAFDGLCDRGELAAAALLHDVVFEHVAIHLYRNLDLAAEVAGARSLGRGVRAILADEREHVEHAFAELARAPLAERLQAVNAAWDAFRPLLDTWGRVAPGTACAQTCSTCSGRCLQLDAAAAGLDLRGGTDRFVAELEASVRRILEGVACAA